MKTIVISNRKGGVAKTTTACCIGQELARRGKRILFIDLDSQGNMGFILHSVPGVNTALDLVTGTPVKQCISTGKYDVIPHSALMDIKNPPSFKSLRDALIPIWPDYDYCIIDCPPQMNMFTVNALYASDAVVIPVQADALSMQGIAQFIGSVRGIEKQTGKRAHIAGILVTRYQGRANISQQGLQTFQNIAKRNGTEVFHTPIRESVRIKEAQSLHRAIYEHAPGSTVAKDYENVTTELLARLNG